MNSREKIIEVKELVKKFGSFTANDHLTFDVWQGEIFGFLGANGAGKTTAMRILCGLSSPTSGEVKVAGFKKAEKIKKRIGYMSQKFSLYEDLTVEENFRFYGGIYGLSGKVIKQQTNLLVHKVGLDAYKHRLIKSLPLGWKQKLAFAVAIMHNPSIVFLDEPTAGVDPITRKQFWEMIYETSVQGMTIFVTTHYMDEAEYCERITIMVDGKIRALDTPGNLKQQFNAANMEEVFLKVAQSEKEEIG
jgi:ABC-2 type transport system ATP-binding protein